MSDDITTLWYPDDAVSISASIHNGHVEVDLSDTRSAEVSYRLRAPVDGLPAWLATADKAYRTLRRNVDRRGEDHDLYFNEEMYFDRSIVLHADVTTLAGVTLIADPEAIEISVGNIKVSCSERTFSRLLNILHSATPG